MLRFKLTDLRRATQLFAFFWANSYVVAFFRRQIYKGPLKASCIPFLNCHACPTATSSCPIGTMQHYAGIHRFPFFVVGQLGLIGLLVGRMICGWLCPFGLLQDLLHALRVGHVRIARAWGHVRYVVLAVLVVLIPWMTAEHWFSKLCPVGTLLAAIPWKIWDPVDPTTGESLLGDSTFGWLFGAKIVLLLGFLALSLVVKRPFCRVVCPLGLIFSFFNRVSLFKLAVSKKCDHCDACEKICPVDIKVYEDPNSSECIRCLDCTSCAHVRMGVRLLSRDRVLPAFAGAVADDDEAEELAAADGAAADESDSDHELDHPRGRTD
jgi:ferredoxin-type protein NapH